MSRDAIPEGSALFIDSNVLIYARTGQSAQCRGLVADGITAPDVPGATSIGAISPMLIYRF
jgi:hypothetical protein